MSQQLFHGAKEWKEITLPQIGRTRYSIFCSQDSPLGLLVMPLAGTSEEGSGVDVVVLHDEEDYQSLTSYLKLKTELLDYSLNVIKERGLKVHSVAEYEFVINYEPQRKVDVFLSNEFFKEFRWQSNSNG